MGLALLTDLYELNMAASYLRHGMTGPATFSLFVRHLPPTRGYLVAAGLESCLRFLEDLRFDQEDLTYLRDELHFDDDVLSAFEGLRFTGDVWAIPEGRIVLANEPLLEVTAPLPEAQLVETYLLNQVTFHTTLASKAARCKVAAGDRAVVDFAFRRTQGVEAAMTVARTSAMVGFAATSNVEAARRYGLVATGTMAHSYIEAFPTEVEAFRAFAADHPGRTTFLVDTYDTLEGVRLAIQVIRELRPAGPLGVRLDSGDLAGLARSARRILDDAGLPSVRIFASGGLDEFAIEELVASGAPIDAFGVGTRMGVSADSPYLDTVYKLVRYGDRDVMKTSPAKVTPPGAKQVFRRPGFVGDVVGLRGETAPEGSDPLLELVMQEGRVVAPATPSQAIQGARERFEADLRALPAGALDMRAPKAPAVRFSAELEDLMHRVRARLRDPGRR